MSGWEGDAHHDLVMKIIRASGEASIPQLLEIRCSGRRGACREVVGWVGETSHGPLGQFLHKTDRPRKGTRIPRRAPGGMDFDLLTFPGDREISVGCGQGHSRILDRQRLLDAIAAKKSSVEVVEVSTPHG